MSKPLNRVTGVFRLFPHKGELPAAFRALVDPKVPLWPKLMVFAALGYLISPMDMLPAFLFPILGGMDDLGVITMAFQVFRKFIQPHHYGKAHQNESWGPSTTQVPPQSPLR